MAANYQWLLLIIACVEPKVTASLSKGRRCTEGNHGDVRSVNAELLQQPLQLIIACEEPKVTASLSRGRRCTEGHHDIVKSTLLVSDSACVGPKVTASLSQGRRCTEGENEISGDGCFKNYACHEPKSPLSQIRNGRQLPMAAADHCLCGAQSHC
jgi:hypothetical protein